MPTLNTQEGGESVDNTPDLWSWLEQLRLRARRAAYIALGSALGICIAGAAGHHLNLF